LKVCILEMPSYTYAVKGEKLLKARGYPCEIKRNEFTGSSGCGFSLAVRRSCREAERILERYSVPYKSSREEGG